MHNGANFLNYINDGDYDGSIIHRLAQLALAIALLITAKLIDWRNRWSPNPPPIR